MEEIMEMLHQWSSQKRLDTFISSQFHISPESSISNSPLKLAEAGFIRKHSAALDEVECLFCGAKYSGWSGESPSAVHRILNPKCIFLNTPPASALTEVASLIGHEHSDDNETVKNMLLQSVHSLQGNSHRFIDIKHPFLPKQGDYVLLFESHRLLTFIHKDLISSYAEMYAEAGFVYNITSKSVFCVFCNLELDFQPVSRFSLENTHDEKSPDCPFVKLFDVGNISMEVERKVHDKVAQQQVCSTEKSAEVNYAIKHPAFEAEAERVGTFSTWPKWLAKVVPGITMAKCGFYYTGFSDKVVCFACGIGLSDWSPEADPALQHAKASPECAFLLQSKGKEFINSAQNIQLIVEKDQETCISQLSETDTSLATDSSSSSSQLPAATLSPKSTPASSSTPGSPVLDLDAIKAALAFRYPNEALLIGTLKAADEHHKRLCEKSHEVLENEALYKKKEAQFQAKEAQLKAEKAAYQQQITVKDRELQRTTCELALRDVVRTELEQQFVEQIQQQKEMLQQQREQIEQRDQVIEYKEIQIQDQERHIQSLMAELKRRPGTSSSDDEESASSDLDHSNSDFGTRTDEIPLANCKVCLIKPSQIMFVPCKHICCCDNCASLLRGKNCPICREQSFGYEKVYLI
ncbi:hypothetical protein BsWGS_01384 [Bradybaena similaris]